MNINKPIFFSIIIPVYNRADCIGRCLESVAKQSLDSFELIIINDGSTDNTVQKISEFDSKFNNFQVISYGTNKGVNYARNRGIENAKGKFLIFLDSDDTLTENALNTIEQYLTQFPKYSHFLFGVSDRINDKTLPAEIHEFLFVDWLSGKVTGDFAHVIQPSCFEGLLFPEEFRIFEALNWLRVLRKNHRQLFIPSIIFNRERNRFDSVTREYNIDNKENIIIAYNFICRYVDWYYPDFVLYNISYKLQAQIRKAIILGIALGEFECNKNLISKLSGNTMLIRCYKLINNWKFSSVVNFLIRTRSLYKRLRMKIR